jgi:hypothetical protein
MTDLAARIADEPERLALWLEAYGTQTPVQFLFDDIAALIRRLRGERDRTYARIEELEKALEPFAKAADELIPGTPDEAGVMWDGIVAMANAGHLRTAARALKGEG